MSSKTAQQSSKAKEVAQPEDGKITVTDHSEKGLAVRGEVLRGYYEEMRKVGVWNKFHRAWMVSKNREQDLNTVLDDIEQGRIQPTEYVPRPRYQNSTPAYQNGNEKRTTKRSPVKRNKKEESSDSEEEKPRTRTTHSTSSRSKEVPRTRKIRQPREDDQVEEEKTSKPVRRYERRNVKEIDIKTVVPLGSSTLHILPSEIPEQTINYKLVRPAVGMHVSILLGNTEIRGNVVKTETHSDVVDTALVQPNLQVKEKNEKEKVAEKLADKDLKNGKQDKESKIIKDEKEGSEISKVTNKGEKKGSKEDSKKEKKDSKDDSKKDNDAKEDSKKETKDSKDNDKKDDSKAEEKEQQPQKESIETYKLVIINGEWKVLGTTDKHSIVFSV